MEIWKQIAINDLKRFGVLQSSLESIKEKLESINAKMVGGTVGFGSTPVQGGGSDLEDKLNNCIVQKAMLQKQLNANTLEYKATARALGRLTKDEQTILDYAYIYRKHGYIDKLINELHVEKTRAYEMKEDALNSFVMAMYGV